MKVIQWASGAMGKTCLKAVIDHPEHELVGLLVYGDSKAGRDAGDIARRGATGVIATLDKAAMLALEADVVIHAARLDPPFERHDEDILRLLASGKHVVSVNGGTFPPLWDNARRAAFEAACAAGGTSFVGAGLNPGFAAEKLAVVASGLCTELRSVRLRETVDCRAVKSAQYVFDVIGFGTSPDQIDPNAPGWIPAITMNAMFRDVVGALAHRLGLTLDDIVTAHRLVAARHDLTIAAGTIPAGTAGRLDWNWLGMVDGKAAIDLGITWTMEPPVPGRHDEASPLWTIEIEGIPCVKITLDLSAPDGWAERTTPEQLGVAGAVINTLNWLADAPPGVHITPAMTPWHAPAS